MKKLLLTFPFIVLLWFNNTVSAQITAITHLSDTITGWMPGSGLYFDGTYLYGTCTDGGSYGMGTIFRVMPDGSNFAILKEYSDTIEGWQPHTDLYSDGTYLYGTTRYGGTSMYYGTLFRMLPDGSGYTKLHDFGSLSYPLTAPIKVGTYLYGVTSSGGTGGVGTIYRIQPDGTGFSTLFNFQTFTTGHSPGGPLYSDGTFLYGVCATWAPNNNGSIYRVLLDGTGFQHIHDFDSINGESPTRNLVSDGVHLYGMTFSGGATTFGTIFKVMPDGSGFTKLKDLGGADGAYPDNSLSYLNGKLYGCTVMWGANGIGTLFSINTDGSNYTVLDDFTMATGGNAIGAMASDGVNLYGVTRSGGTNSNGTIFKYQYSGVGIPDNSTSINLKLFPNPASNNVVLSLSEQNAEYITIADENGKVVYQSKGLFTGDINIPVDQLTSGIYFMNVQLENGKVGSQQFLVKH